MDWVDSVACEASVDVASPDEAAELSGALSDCEEALLCEQPAAVSIAAAVSSAISYFMVILLCYLV